jgi:hypothetical protein
MENSEMDMTTQVTLKTLFDIVGSMQVQMDIMAGVMGLVDPNAPQEGQKAIEQKKRDLDDLFQKLAATTDPVPLPTGEMVEVEGMDVAATLQILLAAQARLIRIGEALTAKLAQQDVTIAAHEAKIQLLTTLVDSHQHVIDVAKANAMQRGRVQ